MLIDDRFESDQLHQFSEHFQTAQEVNLDAEQANVASVTKQVRRISLEDPVHEILERAGSSASQIWTTSACFNNFPLPNLSIDWAEECIALTALKMGLYSLQLREARLAKERDLIIAQTSAEQAAAAALANSEAERKAFAEERQRFDNELGRLQVQLAAAQAKVSATEVVQVRFEEKHPCIPDG
ncbi:unnamed protein product, partial [Cuscuta europaea]